MAGRDIATLLTQIDWARLVQSLTEASTDDAVEVAYGLVGASITMRPANVDTFIGQGGLGRLVNLATSRTSSANKQRGALITLTELLSSRPHLVQNLGASLASIYTPPLTGPTTDNGHKALVLASLSKLVENAGLRSHVVCAQMLSHLIASMPVLSAAGDGMPFGLLCSLISEWEDLNPPVVHSALSARQAEIEAWLLQFISRHIADEHAWPAFGLWRMMILLGIQNVEDKARLLQEKLTRSPAIWWSTCSDLARHGLISINSQTKEMWLNRVQAVLGLLLLAPTEPSVGWRGKWYPLYDTWMSQLARSQVTPTETMMLALNFLMHWAAVEEVQVVKMWMSGGLVELWRDELMSERDVTESVTLKTMISLLRYQGTGSESLRSQLQQFLIQSSPLLRRNDLHLPPLLYLLTVGDPHFQDIVIPILVENVGRMEESVKMRTLVSLIGQFSSATPTLKTKIKSLTKYPTTGLQFLQVLAATAEHDGSLVCPEMVDLVEEEYSRANATASELRRALISIWSSLLGSSVASKTLQEHIYLRMSPHFVALARDAVLLGSEGQDSPALYLIWFLLMSANARPQDSNAASFALVLKDVQRINALFSLQGAYNTYFLACLASCITRLPDKETGRYLLESTSIIPWLEGVLRSISLMSDGTYGHSSLTQEACGKIVRNLIISIWNAAAFDILNVERWCTTSFMKVILGHGQNKETQRSLLGCFSPLSALVPISVWQEVSSDEQWPRVMNLGQRSVASMTKEERAIAFLMLDITYQLHRRGLSIQEAMLKAADCKVDELCARCGWEDEELGLVWSEFELNKFIVPLLACASPYAQTLALWTLNYIVHKPGMDKASIMACWNDLEVYVIKSTGHRRQLNASLASSLLLAMNPGYNLLGFTELCDKAICLITGDGSTTQNAAPTSLLPLLAASSGTPSLALMIVESKTHQHGELIAAAPSGYGVGSALQCAYCGQVIESNLTSLLLDQHRPVHCTNCLSTQERMDKAEGLIKQGQYNDATVILGGLLEEVQCKQASESAVARKLASAKLLHGLRHQNRNSCREAALLIRRYLATASDPQVLELAGLALLFSGEILNGLQKLRLARDCASLRYQAVANLMQLAGALLQAAIRERSTFALIEQTI